MLILLVCVCLLGTISSVLMLQISAKKGVFPLGIISGILSLGTLLIVVPENVQLTNGSAVTVLQKAGGISITKLVEVAPRANELLAVCLFAFIVGEALVVALTGPRQLLRDRSEIWNPAHTRRFVGLAMLFGVASVVILRLGVGVSPVNRGTQQGIGPVTSGTWLLMFAAIALLQDRNAFSAKVRWFLILVALGADLSQLNRSPIILLGCYLLIRVAQRISAGRIGFRALVVGIVVAYALSVSVSVINLWRGSIIHHTQSTSVLSDIEKVWTNPIGALPQNANLDTFNGAMFVTLLEGSGITESAREWEVALTTYVPSEIWHSKPLPLSDTLSHDYLHYGNSGIFLSGAGFASITLGGLPEAGVLWFLVGILGSLVLRRTIGMRFDYLWMALVLYLLVAMWYQGDAFAIYFVTSLMVLFGIFAWITRPGTPRLKGRRTTSQVTRDLAPLRNH